MLIYKKIGGAQMKRLVITALLISIVLSGLSMSALAEDKMTRGSKNVALGWTEIPKAITQTTKDTDNPFLGITIGLLKGVANAFARTTSGAVDVITLPAGSGDQAVKDSMVEVPSSK